MRGKKLLLVAGGTGGHVFPAYALADCLQKDKHEILLLTDKRGGSYGNTNAFFQIKVLPLGKKGTGFWARAGLILSLGSTFFLSLVHIFRFRPDIIIGFGGFPTLSPLAAAIFVKWIWGHKIVLHEQNAFLGRVNRWLAPFAQILALSFPKTWGLKDSLQKKSVVTGNFVRSEFQHQAYIPSRDEDKINLLIIGGSQGARSFSTLIPNALSSLSSEMKSRLHVVQQSRPETLEQTQIFYKKLGIQATVAPFFPHIASEMEKSHLIICRSGASTVFEVAQMGRPALYIPFPHAMDNHQYFNALVVSEMLKGGWLFQENQETQEALNALLKTLISSPKKLATAAQNVHDLVREDATVRFSKVIKSL